jgi:hypothetical protein
MSDTVVAEATFAGILAHRGVHIRHSAFELHAQKDCVHRTVKEKLLLHLTFNVLDPTFKLGLERVQM